MTAREIARDFVSTMNPSGWDGVCYKLKPSDFHGEVWKTYSYLASALKCAAVGGCKL